MNALVSRNSTQLAQRELSEQLAIALLTNNNNDNSPFVLTSFPISSK